jgi:hypothetical protein
MMIQTRFGAVSSEDLTKRNIVLGHSSVVKPFMDEPDQLFVGLGGREGVNGNEEKYVEVEIAPLTFDEGKGVWRRHGGRGERRVIMLSGDPAQTPIFDLATDFKVVQKNTDGDILQVRVSPELNPALAT